MGKNIVDTSVNGNLCIAKFAHWYVTSYPLMFSFVLSRLKATLPVTWILQYSSSNERLAVEYDPSHDQYPSCAGIAISSREVNVNCFFYWTKNNLQNSILNRGGW